MKSTLVAFAVFGISAIFLSCTSSSKSTTPRYFGEGSHSPDTLYLRSRTGTTKYVLDRSFGGGVGGSSQDTLTIRADESVRVYKVKDDKKP